jgi:serine/threonine-protein kinase
MTDTTPLAAAFGGRYQIDRQVGLGGMAVVYPAHDTKHDRRVALKVLRPEPSAVMGVDRFPREIRLVARMQHPHILPLPDSGAAAGLRYFVMRFVEGETLRQRLARTGPLADGETLRLLRENADAPSSTSRDRTPVRPGGADGADGT